MTIKEMEARLEMTRANIRYYETEGLIAPARGSNGYRDYSEKDLETLQKIKLLRSLQFSLEEIKALQSGSRELTEALERQMVKLQNEEKQLEHSREICRVMREDGVRYQTLDAGHYLGVIEQQDWPMPPWQDSMPAVRIPWRRYFARSMDLLIYTVLWNMFLALVFKVNIGLRSGEGQIWDDYMVLLFMLLAEPVLLAVFGSTPGKWLLGIRVTDNEGRRLTLGEGFSRTWKVLWRGMGMGVPIWSLYRLWKSYKGCMEEETLEWEYDSEIVLKDEKGWRAAVYLLVGAFLLAVFAAAIQISALPVNRGDLTVAEFSENYNYYTKYYGYESGSSLDEEGNWVEERHSGQGYTIVLGEYERPDYQFLESDGIMTGMYFTMEGRGVDDWIGDYRSECLLSVLAFAGAQKEHHIFSREFDRVAKLIQNAEGEGFELSVYGIDVSCEVAYSGYAVVPGFGMLMPIEDEEKWYSISFSMTKREK